MPRESILAFRFAGDGAIPFEAGDLDDFNRAQRELETIRLGLGEIGGRIVAVKVSSRKKGGDAHEAVGGQCDDRRQQDTAPAPAPRVAAGADPPMPDLPPALDRTRKA